MKSGLRGARARLSRLRGSRGYNMIEVLIALSVLAVGAAGVIALQKVTILGVTEGRNLAAGSAVAAHHIEAVRTDALGWTGGAPATPLLQALVTAAATAPGWTLLAGNLGDELGKADVTGRTGAAAGAVAYCTHMRVLELATDVGSPDPAERVDPILYRLEARTFWAKSGRDVSAECDAVATITSGLDGTPMTFAAYGTATYTADQYGWVFLSTTVRRNDVAP